MPKTRNPFHGYRFPASIISCAVRWYHRFNLSLRDIEELLLERGVTVTYESVRNWCDRFGAQFAHCTKAVRGRPGTTWHLDELFVKLRGEPYVLWRAVDEHGTELDVLLQKRRDKAAAKRFFRRHPARKPGTPEDRHRPVAQLPGGKGRGARTGRGEARVCEGLCPAEQPGRKQSPAHAPA